MERRNKKINNTGFLHRYQMQPGRPNQELNPKYPRQRVIAVDVDGTLHRLGILNREVIEWLRNRKKKGFKLILWSSRGEDYARRVAEKFEVTDIFDVIISKPGYVLDDDGWKWIKFTYVINRLIDL